MNIPKNEETIGNKLIARADLVYYWRLIKTIESMGEFWDSKVTKTINVSFEISHGTGDDFYCIRIERMYYTDGSEKILVSDYIQNVPPSIQTQAINFYISRDTDKKIVVSPYKEKTVPQNTVDLMKKAGILGHREGAKLLIRTPTKLDNFVLVEGNWQSCFH